MNSVQQAIKLKTAAKKRGELLGVLSLELGISLADQSNIFEGLETSEWVRNRLLLLRKDTPSKFVRCKPSLYEQNLFQQFKQLESIQVFITLVRWEGAGAILLQKEQLLENMVGLIGLDGDGFSGCSIERDVIFSVDYDPDYPSEGKYEILLENV